jgi:putative membrane protein insertion efficiency factor
MKQTLVYLIKAYKVAISPLLPFNHCRFFPSCSDYAVEAIEKHGAMRGSVLAAGRLFRCHPLHKHSGYDPVPDPTTNKTTV